VRVAVTLLRSHGRAIPRAEWRSIEGELSMVRSDGSIRAILVAADGVARSMVPDLLSPQLIGIGNDGMRLRGFEEVGDAIVAQEWWCEVRWGGL
jgi:hypothetical protein